jgi:dCTP deaminase
MILTGPEIARAITIGDITITPFNPMQLNPNSYNYRLGDRLIVVSATESMTRTEDHATIDSTGYILHPGKLYLGHTAEQIGSNRYVTTLLGRSSVGRLGLFLNITADLGHVGSLSQWTLELTVVQPLRVYPGMLIGQVAFWEISGTKSSYLGRYHGDLGPVRSLDPSLRRTVPLPEYGN